MKNKKIIETLTNELEESKFDINQLFIENYKLKNNYLKVLNELSKYMDYPDFEEFKTEMIIDLN